MNSILLESYTELQERLRVRLMDVRSNAEVIKKSVCQAVGCGYALVAYIDLPERADGDAVMNVPKEMAKMMEVAERRIMFDALLGSLSAGVPKLCTLESVLFGDRTENILQDEGKLVKDSLLVLSTEEGVLGAAALYYPGIQKKIGEIVGGDYFVLPSSVHEVLIMPDRAQMEPADMAMIVKEINEQEVSPEERLGNRVLHFRTDLQRLQVAADMDTGKNREAERG